MPPKYREPDSTAYPRYLSTPSVPRNIIPELKGLEINGVRFKGYIDTPEGKRYARAERKLGKLQMNQLKHLEGRLMTHPYCPVCGYKAESPDDILIQAWLDAVTIDYKACGHEYVVVEGEE